MPMKPAVPRVFVAAIVLLPAWSALAQRRAALEEEPMPPSIAGLPGGGAPTVQATSQAPQPDAPATTVNPDSFLPSLMGPIGLYHMSTAEVGPQNHLRLALHGEYFKSSSFLVDKDVNSRMNGSFTFGYTPHPNLELFGALLTSSNRNHRTNPAETGRRDPELIKSFGDLVLGSKAALPVARGLTIGFELGLRFLSSISDLSVSPSSTSLWLGPLFTLDLRPINNTPLRFHAAANFYVDNSNNLIDFSDPTITIFTREVAMFAYGIAANRVRFALGIDVPLEKLTAPVPLQPFAEYHAEIVTASADPAFKAYTSPNNRDQQWLTFGLRARVYRGITLDAGTDVRIRSVGYAYGPPLPPYNIVFGASYPLDIDAFTRPIVVTRTIERNGNAGPPPAVEGQLQGIVKSSRDGKPVAGALVGVPGRPLSRVASDPDGAFLTVPLPPGPAELEVSAAGFEPAKVKAAVILGRPSKLDVTLTQKTLTGNVRGKVTDSKGHALQASLRFTGSAEAFSAQADASGVFSASLPVGPYKVTAEMPTMPSKEASLDIVEGQDKELNLVMRSPNPNVALTAEGITLKQPIKFRAGAPRLEPKIQAELDGVAELLQDHPEVRSLRIEAYWDSSAGNKDKALTESQAQAVKAYLVKKGVAENRVEAVGQGAEKPLVPNIGPVNKAKNRRVELHTVQ
jgi:outer membrane protein OmpA-like peptidoglycan-associated protein